MKTPNNNLPSSPAPSGEAPGFTRREFLISSISAAVTATVAAPALLSAVGCDSTTGRNPIVTPSAPTNPQPGPGTPEVGKTFSVAMSASPARSGQANKIDLRVTYITSVVNGRKTRVTFRGFQGPRVGSSQTQGEVILSEVLDPARGSVEFQNIEFVPGTNSVRCIVEEVSGGVIFEETVPISSNEVNVRGFN